MLASPVHIVFDNENLVAVDKSACWLTTPARERDDPRPCLGRDLQALLKQQIYPVHRLDFEVSGLVLFAKTPSAHRSAQKWFEQQMVDKTYQAVCERTGGTSEWSEWRSHLVRGKRRSFEAPHGSLSITRARLADPVRRLWELMPVTGRPHQLRVEMARHPGPIEGDVLYGATVEATDSARGIALRAVALDFSRIEERLGLPQRLEVSALVWP
ncbi:MAG: RNA pseudouridine synthase [Bdellovibrionales bacterium]|nr:RNA pseudouridine synthase [Bdellovibrionales bacterium]